MTFPDYFIGASTERCELDRSLPAPYFRKEFSIDFKPKKAEILIAGLGFYRLWINGREITKGELAPYISEPNDLVCYDCYDPSSLLHEGINCIGVQLGNGFRNDFAGFPFLFDRIPGRGPVCFALSLSVGACRKHFSLSSDESFKTAPSPVIFDSWRFGCHYDAQAELPGWCDPGYDDADWQNAVPIEKPKGEPMLCPITLREINRRTPISVKKLEETYYAHKDTAPDAEPFAWSRVEDGYLFDFGVVSTGKTVLKIKGKPGQKIVIRHADFSHGNGITVRNLIPVVDGVPNESFMRNNQVNVYICRGGDEVFEPCFCYASFRYCLVEGLFDDQITDDLLTFVEFSAIFERRSDFSCSDRVLNKLYENVLRSDQGNMIYLPTDCPHREKNGWTGDAGVSAEQFAMNFDCYDVLSTWFASVRKAQLEDGVIPPIIPGGVTWMWGNGPAWDKVIVDIPYYLYQYTGRTDIITENAEMIHRYFTFAGKIIGEDGLSDYGLGDWCCPSQQRTGRIQAPLKLTSSACLYDFAVKAAFLFGRVGLSDYQKDAEAFAYAIRTAIRAKLIDFDTMTAFGDCQTSQVFAIGTGLFDEAELPAAVKRLVAIIERDGGENECGILGMRYLPHILTDWGYEDLAYHLITSEKHTSFGYWIKEGATSMWEGFSPVDGPRVNSRNHHFFGDISCYMIKDIVGIRPYDTLTGEEECLICPHFPSALTYAEGAFDFPSGRVSCRFERFDDGIHVTVQAPENLPCTFSYGDILLPVCGLFEITLP